MSLCFWSLCGCLFIKIKFMDSWSGGISKFFEFWVSSGSIFTIFISYDFYDKTGLF